MDKLASTRVKVEEGQVENSNEFDLLPLEGRNEPISEMKMLNYSMETLLRDGHLSITLTIQ